MADLAEATGYLPQLRSIVRSAAAPVWWWRESQPAGGSILHSGTICALDTGTRKLCVTADHVYSQYLADLERAGDVECQVGDVRIRLEQYLVARDPESDIATFEISPILLAGSGIRIQKAKTWPPKMLSESEIVVLGGFPGMFRREREAAVDFSFACFFAPVAQSSATHTAYQLNLADSHWPDGSGGVPERSELGGMSGGPIYRYHREPVEFLELAGFIYEASSQFELIRGRHAACIAADGAINKM